MKTLQEEALDDLRYRIARYELINADNFRVARTDSYKEIQAYNRQRSKGCCGFFDDCTTIEGVKFRIGCNYGH